jgi:two-component sensor histidine kinase
MVTSLTLILIFSILFQLSAAAYALYLIKFTGFKYSWIFISSALILMGVRRIIPLLSIISGTNYAFDLTNEVIGLVLSFFMLIGVKGIGSILIERKSAENKISILLKENELILKEVHHRIKNNMNTTYGLIALQAESITDPQAKRALEDSASRVQAMITLYEELFISGNYSEVSMKKYLPLLAERIISNFPKREMITLDVSSDDFTIDEKKLSGIGLIVNELLTNIMKYAFVGKDSGKISISLLNKENKVLLCICDNGNGIPENIDLGNSTGFGLSLVDMLTKQLEGKLSFESNNGTKVILEFPS